MEHQTPLLSIVTPTYNRCSLLQRCYSSLRNQTCYNFEWIIVDDGSTDDTGSVASAFKSDLFPICYHKKNNGGKHTALNASHKFIHGKYVLILDSDDYLTENAVEEVIIAWGRYSEQKQIGILTFLRMTENGIPFCTVQDYDTPVSAFAHQRKRLIGNDCCEVIRSELFFLYPFPEFSGERFLAEGALWERVGLKYKMVYINCKIYVCEYLEDGLTKIGRSLRIKNPKGGMFVSELRMDRGNNLKGRLKNALLYNCYGSIAKVSVVDRIKQSRSPVISALGVIPGMILAAYWKQKYSLQL